MGGDAEGEGNDDEIFNYVLSLKCGDEKAGPDGFRCHEKREKGCYHVRDEECDCETFFARNNENDTEYDFVYAETDEEGAEFDEWECALEELVDDLICGAHLDDFQEAEPEENREECRARKRG